MENNAIITATIIASDAALLGITNDINEDSLKEKIIAYAKIKCKEQRKICADLAEANKCIMLGIEDAKEPLFE